MLKNVLSTVFGTEPEPTIARGAEPQAQAAAPAEKPQAPARITIGEAATWQSVSGKTIEARPYRMRKEWENRHTLIAGTTGAGKSTLFYQMFDQIAARGTDKALIIDHGGENIARYYSAERGDVILNPFDARCPGWSPFNEMRDEHDADNLAGFIVSDGVGEGAAWAGYAQAICAGVLRQQMIRGGASIADLVYLMTIADPEKLKELFGEFEPAASLYQKGSEKMAANARSILGDAIRSWRYIEDGKFSIRDWVENDNDKRWIFLSYKESSFRAIRGFLSMAVSIAINYTLDLKTDENRRIWFSLDEMASLPKMGVVTDALTKIRKKGGCVLAGLQAASQPQEIYGDKGATTLLANFNTWIGMRSGDADTAELFSRHFGEQEEWRRNYSDSTGQGNGGSNTGESVSTQLHTQRVLTYTESMLLPDLTAVVKFPGNLPCAYLKVPYVKRPMVAEPFIPRARK